MKPCKLMINSTALAIIINVLVVLGTGSNKAGVAFTFLLSHNELRSITRTFPKLYVFKDDDGQIQKSKSKHSRIQRQRQRQRQLQPNRKKSSPVHHGKNERPFEKTVVILYHKPKNVITSHSNSDLNAKDNLNERKTVYEDVMSMKGYLPNTSSSTNDNVLQNVSPSSWSTTSCNEETFQKTTGIHSKLHAIGRLDAETTGLLLLTNDGQLLHHVTNPTAASAKSLLNSKKKKNTKDNPVDKLILKTYEALIMGYHTLPNDINKGNQYESQLDNKFSNNSNSSHHALLQLTKGVDIGAKYGGMTKPVHNLQVLDHPTEKSTLVRITIGEGKNRQVRRMFHAIGSGVMQLHRIQVGNINLSMLRGVGSECAQEGCWRLLSENEIYQGLGWEVRRIETVHIPRTKATKITVKSNVKGNKGRRIKQGRRN